MEFIYISTFGSVRGAKTIVIFFGTLSSCRSYMGVRIFAARGFLLSTYTYKCVHYSADNDVFVFCKYCAEVQNKNVVSKVFVAHFFLVSSKGGTLRNTLLLMFSFIYTCDICLYLRLFTFFHELGM